MANEGIFFSSWQRQLIAHVLDRIIPPGDGMPGGGEVSLEFVDKAVGDSPGTKKLFSDGIGLVEVISQREHSGSFIDLSEGQKNEVLKRVEKDAPNFFEALVRHTYSGYYSNPHILDLLGLESGPPQPAGHRVAQGNLDLLENVKGRGAAYREVSD